VGFLGLRMMVPGRPEDACSCSLKKSQRGLLAGGGMIMADSVLLLVVVVIDVLVLVIFTATGD
jgi:hypothetical protein